MSPRDGKKRLTRSRPSKVGKHTVTLEFILDEEVTPEIFVMRVARACAAYNAIRGGEGVRVPGSDVTYVASILP